MEALVSIVVPVYNAERYILSCVHALQGQDYPNFEIILVDDGSRDTSPVTVSYTHLFPVWQQKEIPESCQLAVF